MTGTRIVAILTLCGVSLGATAVAMSAPPRPYALAATKACLEGLPDAITGLPPATPPDPSAPFVYRLPADRVHPPVHRQLGAWHGRRGQYEGVILSFFDNARAAQTHLKSRYAGKRLRNVVLEWSRSSISESWRRTVTGCLLTVPRAGTPGPTRPTPPASLATIAGYWGGHTRRLEVGSGGQGLEVASSGCCHRVYRMTFQIQSVHGTLTAATAFIKVTSFARYDRTVPKLRVGQVGELRLRNGIITNTLTKVFYCSDPAWWATGACGA